MSPEAATPEVKTVHPALEKLRGLFTWLPFESDSNGLVSTHKLNEHETLELVSYSVEEPFRQLVICTARRDGKLVFEFNVGQNGLEKFGFGSLELSFMGSPRINLRGAIGIGVQGEVTSDLYVQKDEWKKYQDLANKCVEWVEDVKFKEELGFLPISLVRQPHSNPDR